MIMIIPTKTDFNKSIFFFFWKASQNMVQYHEENPQACFNIIDEENWGNHEIMTVDNRIQEKILCNLHLTVLTANKQLNLALMWY